jgi:hypothetical protein
VDDNPTTPAHFRPKVEIAFTPSDENSGVMGTENTYFRYETYE